MDAPDADDGIPDLLPPARRSARAGGVSMRSSVTRGFFIISALVSALAALSFGIFPGVPLDRRGWVAVPMLVLALTAVLSLRARRQQWIERAMLGVLALAVLAIANTAVVLQWGLAAPGLAFYGLFVCVLCAAANPRLGGALAGVSVLTLLAVLAATHHAPVPGQPGDAIRLGSLLAQIGVGLIGGLLVSRVVAGHMRAADDREERFRGLLGIAADAYWEIDQNYRVIYCSDQHSATHAAPPVDVIGRMPWDLPQFASDPDALDALLADLDMRVPFRDRLAHWSRDDGEVRSYMVSGEPRFDRRGVFTGYWGVARDITHEIAAQHALAATETRYQELFARIPTPLVLHRDGYVLDANPAALALFGHEDLDAMLGRDLLATYESGDSRERERRRLEGLVDEAVGAALPVADFRLRPRSGRRVSVRATGVRVEAEGGPAVLSIYVDDTERRSAEEAVRRSEAMLSHLVATSPDLISLSELATGRYAMVNDAFERVTGYRANEVIGKTAVELGIWHRPADRERFMATLRERGSVGDVATLYAAKDGSLVSMLVSGARFVMDRRDYLVINARDVTASERTRLEREAILQNASIGIAVTREQHFVLANPSLEQMFGWAPGALVGKPGSVVWPTLDAYAEVGRAVAAALGGGEQVELERTMRRRDGSTFLGRLLAKAIDPLDAAQGGTIWIIEDVTERRQTEQALAAARDAAEAASRAKSAFLANTSHELRTPLNGMLHLAQMARDPMLDAPRRHQYLDQIAESAQSLADIISDILDLSKIEAGKLDLETTPFDLGELLRAVQRSYATLTAARDLTLDLDIGAGVDGAVAGDPVRVRQILSNFLSNAIKFTAVGRVRIRAGRDGDRVRLEVHDSGPGIPRETQDRLFRPFTQADQSTTRRFGGTGLGLSICRELATLMGGRVGVVSEPGDGSMFWAEVPLPQTRMLPLPAPDAGQRGELRGAYVLMAEDNPVNMLIAVALLERWGVRVEQAGDGRQAVDAVQRAASTGRPFDAVLMDVQMPVMSGYEATRALRYRDNGRRLPIIALTAAALVSERQAALAAGMDDFLTKPIDADKLRDTLARWVRRDS